MIHNLPFPAVLIQLASSQDFAFFLTGSRFFGTSGPNSDWDFFVQDDDWTRVNGGPASGITPLKGFLADNGFELNVAASKQYTDVSIVAVYENKPSGVQIQVVTDASIKDSVQTKLFGEYGRNFPKNKRVARDVWDKAMVAAIRSSYCS